MTVMAAEFFTRRKGTADGSGLINFLEKAPDTTPEVDDQF
jgi:hypothetical protein